jgi:hypothetical protein
MRSCEGYITGFLNESQCFHIKCKKCNKLSGLSEAEGDLENGDREREREGKKPKGWRAWLLRSG